MFGAFVPTVSGSSSEEQFRSKETLNSFAQARPVGQHFALGNQFAPPGPRPVSSGILGGFRGNTQQRSSTMNNALGNASTSIAPSFHLARPPRPATIGGQLQNATKFQFQKSKSQQSDSMDSDLTDFYSNSPMSIDGQLWHIIKLSTIQIISMI